MTKAQEQFLDQYTRKLMVGICKTSMVEEDLPGGIEKVFLDYAISKKWISADGTRVLSAGWATAARFLKR